MNPRLKRMLDQILADLIRERDSLPPAARRKLDELLLDLARERMN